MTSVILKNLESNTFTTKKSKINFKKFIRDFDNYDKLLLIKKYFDNDNKLYTFNVIRNDNQFIVTIYKLEYIIDDKCDENVFENYEYKYKFVNHLREKFIELEQTEELKDYLINNKKYIINEYFKINPVLLYDYNVVIDNYILQFIISQKVNESKISKEEYDDMLKRKQERLTSDFDDTIKNKMKLEQLKHDRAKVKELEMKERKFKKCLKKLKKDLRVDKKMIQLYIKIHWDYPMNDIANPMEILNDIKYYKLKYYKYLYDIMNSDKDDEDKQLLLNNSYTEYMGYILGE
jgi:hypothetical protein